ncbi:MAG: MBL fold metallo-hydrolase [Defluviitaleaceae bacterium]|nr:MBL fold metallo-hydrolase [Defluviitaleaceae bacterium]
MRIAKNVALLPIKNGEGAECFNLVLTWDDDNLVLIDAGFPSQTDAILSAIAAEGFRAENLTHMIITHHDWDHVGCVPDLQKLAPNVRMIAHVDESPYLDGRRLPVKVEARLKEYDTLPEDVRAFYDSWKKSYEDNPIHITDQVTDGQVYPICGGIEIVHVPGHTPGHIVVHLRDSGIMVCGDAANVDGNQLVGANPIHTQDLDLANQSLDKIKGYSVSGYVAYHTGYLPVP